MLALQKSNKKISSRRQINIKGVQDGILMLPNKQYRLVLEASSINFELKSEEEQDALIDTYESFLNSLPCAVQIIVRVRELDMSGYLTELKTKKNSEQKAIYREQLTNYIDFVKGLVADNKILSRKFYVILPYRSEDDDLLAAKERLLLNSDMVRKGLMRLGVHTRALNSIEILDLFHSFYNPARSKRQPITEQVVRMLSSSVVKGERHA